MVHKAVFRFTGLLRKSPLGDILERFKGYPPALLNDVFKGIFSILLFQEGFLLNLMNNHEKKNPSENKSYLVIIQYFSYQNGNILQIHMNLSAISPALQAEVSKSRKMAIILLPVLSICGV